MSAKRVFVVSLVLSVVCLALFARIPSGEQPLDLRFFGYGTTVVEDYLRYLENNQLTTRYLGEFRLIDSVFPLGVFGMLASALYGFWSQSSRMLMWVGLVVCGAYLIADYVENAAIHTVIAAGSKDVSEPDVTWASLLTQIKWACVLGASALIALGASRWLARRRQA